MSKMAAAANNDIPVAMAEAVPLYPPKPDAIITLLTTDDFLPGAQTLLYSVKKTLPKKNEIKYPPELVVLCTPNVTETTRKALCPAFCTRIIEVEPLSFPEKSLHGKQVVSSHVESWTSSGSLTKLHIFRLDVYDTTLYVDADCLVVKDVSHLLELGKVYQESEALIAAAPDLFPPDKFNGGVLVVRPSKKVFDNMIAQASLLTTYDGGDTGFLNAYYPEWHPSMPPMARLKYGYNAQRFLYHCTYEKQPNYWDLAVAPDLHIVHYSSSPKPWETKNPATATSKDDSTGAIAQAHLDAGDVKTLTKVKKTAELEALWWIWYKRSQNYAGSYEKEQLEKEKEERTAVAATRAKNRPTVATAASSAPPKVDIHKLITTRYKELRREGKSAKEAMEQARREHGQMDDNAPSVSAQVAAMFGLSSVL